MKQFAVGLMMIVLVASGCGGDSALTADQETWCTENFDAVDDASEDLGLIDYVAAYYDTEGDGLGSDGEPEQTDRNIEVSEELRARNSEDPEALVDDLVSNYLDHPDGQEACAAAYADNT